jgi:hypothetical protein
MFLNISFLQYKNFYSILGVKFFRKVYKSENAHVCMKKESWKILGILILSVLLISLVANFVAAQNPFTEFFGDGAKAVYSDWLNGEDFNANISKILLT